MPRYLFRTRSESGPIDHLSAEYRDAEEARAEALRAASEVRKGYLNEGHSPAEIPNEELEIADERGNVLARVTRTEAKDLSQAAGALPSEPKNKALNAAPSSGQLPGR